MAALLLCGVSAAAAPKVDVVVLRNGSRVIGEVVSMSKSRLELKTDDMGTLQIEWDNIVALTAPGFFEVEDFNGGLRFGSLKPAQAQETLEIVADWGNEEVPLWQVARIQLVKSGFWDKFSGSFDAGSSYTSATELKQLTFDGQLRYTRTRFEAFVETSAVLTRQPDVEDTQRASLTLGYTRIFANRHRIFTSGSFERNQELGYDLRSSVAGGWAYALVLARKTQLLAGAGLALNREQPVEGETTTNLEATFGVDFARFAYDYPNIDVQLSATGYVGLNQWGRFRLETSLSLKRELFSDFYFGVRGYESYDSDPATEGAEKNDWGVSVTLGYSF